MRAVSHIGGGKTAREHWQDLDEQVVRAILQNFCHWGGQQSACHTAASLLCRRLATVLAAKTTAESTDHTHRNPEHQKPDMCEPTCACTRHLSDIVYCKIEMHAFRHRRPVFQHFCHISSCCMVHAVLQTFVLTKGPPHFSAVVETDATAAAAGPIAQAPLRPWNNVPAALVSQVKCGLWMAAL